MRILCIDLCQYTFHDMLTAFKNAGIKTDELRVNTSDYLADPALKSGIRARIKSNRPDAFFSFNYIPAVAEEAHDAGIIYISWIYDCPNLTVYHSSVKYPENRFFIFDKVLASTVIANGASFVRHLPLAAAVSRIDGILSDRNEMKYDVSFIGSLYNKNEYDSIKYLSDRLRGYIDGIIAAQRKISGYNMVDELLTDEVESEFKKYVSFEILDTFSYTARDLISGFINKKITNMDRNMLLCLLSDYFNVDLFGPEKPRFDSKTVCHGPVDYNAEMPRIFRESKINLNISLRSITSGIPLRCIDIMAAGGFLMSTYQPELCEFFEPGVDFVYYESEYDLVDKCSYYLAHEDERARIAKSGHDRVSAGYTYDIAVKRILDEI